MARTYVLMTTLFASGLAFAFGCSGAGGGGSNPGTGASAGSGATSGSGGGINIGGAGNEGGSGNTAGGWTCTQYEPGAIDVPGNGKDDDCSGTPDDAPANCDGAIAAVEDNDPMSAAKALGLCQVSDGVKWGVIEAKYVKADGSPAESMPAVNTLQHGLLPAFGPAVNPQEGTRMLGLSSGTARRPSDPGYQDVGGFDAGSMGTAPSGFPIDSPSCPGVTTANDPVTYNPVGLELKIKAPLNAKSLKYNFTFYTYEFPVFVCTQYNDFFVALQSPAPSNALQGNISFDSQGNPVSVNNGFLEVCSPQSAGGKTFACSQGTGQLSGTGFEDHAATGWLETVSPVTPGEVFTLRFAIWDMGDEILDSTVLIDNFQFSAEGSTGSVTTPIPVPK